MGRFKVRIGSSFEIDDLSIEDTDGVAPVAQAAEVVAAASTRAFVVRAVVYAVLVALLGAAAIGVYTADFGHLSAVWMATGPLIGAIVGHYFRANEED